MRFISSRHSGCRSLVGDASHSSRSAISPSKTPAFSPVFASRPRWEEKFFDALGLWRQRGLRPRELKASRQPHARGIGFPWQGELTFALGMMLRRLCSGCGPSFNNAWRTAGSSNAGLPSNSAESLRARPPPSRKNVWAAASHPRGMGWPPLIDLHDYGSSFDLPRGHSLSRRYGTCRLLGSVSFQN